MKLSCLPVSRYPDLAAGRLTLAGWFRMAAGLGLDGADFSVAHVPSRRPADLDHISRAAADAGVALPMLVTYSDFTHPDARHRAAQHDDLRGWIDAAARMGVECLRVTAGQAHDGVAEDDGLAWAAEGLAAHVHEAASMHVRLLYENHTRASIWQRFDFTQPAARFLEVARRTAGSGLQILFDTANCLALGEDPLPVLDAIIDRVGGVHVSDIAARGTFEPTTIGTGVAPLASILKRLVDHGYDGWLSIEEASRTGDDGFLRGVAYVDRVWVESQGRPRVNASAT